MDIDLSHTENYLPCWIYILQDKITAAYQIGYTTNAPTNGASDKKLVYLRSFDDFADAMGHKLFLEQISTASLRRILRMHNPKLKDLRETM
jgi:hypothetical protein